MSEGFHRQVQDALKPGERIVYGDGDSVMITFGDMSVEEIQERTTDLVRELNNKES